MTEWDVLARWPGRVREKRVRGYTHTLGWLINGALGRDERANSVVTLHLLGRSPETDGRPRRQLRPRARGEEDERGLPCLGRGEAECAIDQASLHCGARRREQISGRICSFEGHWQSLTGRRAVGSAAGTGGPVSGWAAGEQGP